jgi:hypothetical protein
MSVNPDHEMDFKEAFESMEIYDKHGNRIWPEDMEVDPYWADNLKPTDPPPITEVTTVPPRKKKGKR